MKRLAAYFKKEAVFSAALLAAVATAFFVPPSAAYFSYLDYKVLTLLFCLMLVVAGLSKAGMFQSVSQFLLQKAHSTKALSFLLVFLCFFSSMLVTNDVALLAFVPLTLSLERVLGKQRLVYLVVLQAIAANLGSMLTPVGNPQNLYLYSYYSISPGDFFAITVPLTAAGFFLLVFLLLFGKNSRIEAHTPQAGHPKNKKYLCLYAVLFLLCISGVFSLIPYYLVTIIVCAMVFFLDRGLFRSIDYSLLLTFVCFFIFVGNINQLDVVKTAASQVVTAREYGCAIALSQVISNVPSAIMLSPFTENYRALVAGTNIGGLGTPVASLASLIALRLYLKSEGAKAGRFLLVFLCLNAVCLILLGAAGRLLLN